MQFIDSDPDLVTSKDADGATPLHYAALHDRKNIVELLIDKSADVNAADYAGETPLHYAANGDIAAILLSAGANVNARDNKGRTALHRAARSGQPVVIGFLLASGAEVNATEWEMPGLRCITRLTSSRPPYSYPTAQVSAPVTTRTESLCIELPRTAMWMWWTCLSARAPQ